MTMKEKIDITDYANLITKALPKEILLNTSADKFNSMVIGWGHIGTLWGRSTFHVYVRQGRFTREQLDKSGEFSVSVPLGRPDPMINRILRLAVRLQHRQGQRGGARSGGARNHPYALNPAVPI